MDWNDLVGLLELAIVQRQSPIVAQMCGYSFSPIPSHSGQSLSVLSEKTEKLVGMLTIYQGTTSVGLSLCFIQGIWVCKLA